MKKRYLFLTLAIFFLSLSYTFYGQSKEKKVCEPLEISFKNFQKKSLNFSLGLGMLRNSVNKENLYGLNGLAGCNYFPAKYLELGVRWKPKIERYKSVGTMTLIENDIYIRYYPIFISCYKVAFFGQLSVFKEGSEYSVKGESINKNTLFPSVSSGLIILFGKKIHIEGSADVFVNRPYRANLSLVWNFKNYLLK